MTTMSTGDAWVQLGLKVPVIQAPVGSATTAALAAAVSASGALGTLALTWHSAEEAAEAVAQAQALTDRPIAVNLVLEWDVAGHVHACLDAGTRIFSFFWGDPSPHIDVIHAAGGTVMHTVGSVDEGRRAVDAGADIVIAQGFEAGGHVRGSTTTMVLVPTMVDALPDTPVIAAGGIADGRGIASALCLGARGAMIGTRFLVCDEANTHDHYKEAVIGATAQDAVYMQLFDVGWPHAPHRALTNLTYRRWVESGSPPTGERPGEGDEVGRRGTTRLVRYGDDIPTADATGELTELARYAGQSAELVRRGAPSREVVADLDRELRSVLDGLAQRRELLGRA
jgi:nitronate monooxygenase